MYKIKIINQYQNSVTIGGIRNPEYNYIDYSSMNIIDKTDEVAEPVLMIEKVDTAIAPEREIAPPVDVKESKGDW